MATAIRSIKVSAGSSLYSQMVVTKYYKNTVIILPLVDQEYMETKETVEEASQYTFNSRRILGRMLWFSEGGCGKQLLIS